MRSNIFQQATQDINGFKAKVLTPEVLESKKPELKAILEKEYNEILASGYVTTKITKMLKNRVNDEVHEYFQSKDFKAQVHKTINCLFAGGVTNGD